jgi:hypothetical protein
MRQIIVLLILVTITSYVSFANKIQGRISDSTTGELLVGCTIYLEELKTGTTSGLDGTFLLKNIPSGKYTLTCSYISYKNNKQTITIEKDKLLRLDIKLEPDYTDLNEVLILGHVDKSTENSARATESNAANIINVMSSKAIELSPDLKCCERYSAHVGGNNRKKQFRRGTICHSARHG